MHFIKSYFLSGYRNASAFEQKKASFLYYFILSALFVSAFVFIGQLILGMGLIYNISGAIALLGILTSLFLFKKKQVEASGHLMAFATLFLVILQNVFCDIYNTNPAIRYRIYMDAASLIGIYFLIISFFRENKVIYFYGVMFEMILFTHSLVIYFNLRAIPEMGVFVWEHFAAVFVAIIVLAFISTWLLGYMNTIIEQNEKFAQRLAQQKEELEKMVEERTQDLLTSNEKLKEFAHIVSHDLKEPLRTISGFVTLIQRELRRLGLDEDDIKEYIDHVCRGTQQMTQLISDILSYSKLSVIDKPSETVPVETVIADVKSVLSKAIYDSEAEIHIRELESVAGDTRLLTQLFQNLISNAIKYRSELRTPVIEIGCIAEDCQVLFYVRDNGMGISEEHFSTVFQAFKRLHSRVDYEGTGIGLAICKKIIDIHRGRIWIESEEGQGTTFYFTLPKTQTEEPAMYPVVHAA